MATTLIVALGSTNADAQDRIWYADGKNKGDWFGWPVVVPDVDADGTSDLLIGAYAVTCANGPADGAAYLFSTRAGGELNEWCGSAESLGTNVSSIGDVDGKGIADFLVSSPFYKVPSIGSETGRVQIFSAETGLQILEVDGTQPFQHLGIPAGFPDLNGDGFPEFLVASPEYSTGSPGIGRVSIFSSKDGSILRDHFGENSFDEFGSQICVLDDADGDGVKDYVVFAPLNNAHDNAVGKVYVYSGATGALFQSWKGTVGGELGVGLAPAEDLDGDGLADLCFGVNTVDRKTVHYRGYSPKSGAQIFNVDGSAKDGFAKVSAMIGDMNRDGAAEFAITTSYDKHDGFNAGKVTVYSGLTLRPLYDFYPGYGQGFFGNTILGGNVDFNGDRIPDLVISAPGTRSTDPKGGRVSVFAGNDLFFQADVTDPAPNTNVTLNVRGGPAGALVMDVVVDVDGSPVWEPIDLTTLDANGELADVETVPPDASGHEFTLIGYSINAKGKLIDTSTEVVSVQ